MIGHEKAVAARLDSTRSEATLLTSQHCQESLSRAYIHAIAAHVGLMCLHRDFDYGIDLTLSEVAYRADLTTGRKRFTESGIKLDIQVKSTTNAVVCDGEVAYDLDRNAYEDLRAVARTPRILVLHIQTKAETERLTVTQNGLIVRERCYWMSLKGLPEARNSSRVRIRIPVSHVLATDSLKEIMRRIRAEEQL